MMTTMTTTIAETTAAAMTTMMMTTTLEWASVFGCSSHPEKLCENGCGQPHLFIICVVFHRKHSDVKKT
jgi:hypothetical protein